MLCPTHDPQRSKPCKSVWSEAPPAIQLAGLVLALALTFTSDSGFPAQVSDISGQRQSASPAFETLHDNAAYRRGAYTAFMAPFNVGFLRPQRDYDETFVVNKAMFPSRSYLSWTYPPDAASSSIKSFLAIDFGNYNHTVASEPIEAATIGSIGTLRIKTNMLISGDVNGFDVIIDYYLTAKAGDLDSKIIELEIALHAPPFFRRYADSARTIGFYKSEDGTVWKLSVDDHAAMMQGKPDILMYPIDTNDHLTIELDISATHRFLVDRYVLKGTEYFNGLALGVEPQQGSGSLSVIDLDVAYAKAAETRDPSR